MHNGFLPPAEEKLQLNFIAFFCPSLVYVQGRAFAMTKKIFLINL